MFFSGYGHCHISGSVNVIKNIFRIFFFFVRPFSSMTIGLVLNHYGLETAAWTCLDPSSNRLEQFSLASTVSRDVLK